MQREYEFTLLTKSDLSEADSEKVLDKYEKIMTRNGGEILVRDNWGVKKLAYPIENAYRGRYTFYDMVSEPANIAEMERLMRIDDNVLRYMSVRIGENINVEERKVELARKATLDQAEDSEDDVEE